MATGYEKQHNDVLEHSDASSLKQKAIIIIIISHNKHECWLHKKCYFIEVNIQIEKSYKYITSKPICKNDVF